MQTVKIGLIYVIGGILFVALAFGVWQVKRYINYNLSYDDQVQEAIDKRLKPLEARIKQLEIEKIEKWGN